MSNIVTNLPNLDQEIQRRHPFTCAQPGLPREVVQMGYQPLHDICEALVGRLRVNEDGVLGDVVDG